MLGVVLPLPVSDCTACGLRGIITRGQWGWTNVYLPSLPEYCPPIDPMRFAALSPSTSLWY